MTNIGFISLDIIILLVILGVLIFLNYKTGKKIITSLILACYPSILIFNNLPYISFESRIVEAFAFILIYVMCFIILKKYIKNRVVVTNIRKITDYIFLSLTFFMLLVSISTNEVLSLQSIYSFSGYLPNLINKINYGLVLIIPIIVLLLTSKEDH